MVALRLRSVHSPSITTNDTSLCRWLVSKGEFIAIRDRKHALFDADTRRIIYVLEGEGYTLVEDERVEWATGDAVHIPVWAWRQYSNTSKTRMCRYVACEMHR